MRHSGIAITAGALILLVTPVVAPEVARAGVPRSCIHPTYDPLACPRDTRLVQLDVLPSARVRVLRRQASELEETVVPVQDRERNILLEQILEHLRR